ncbi:MAG: ATP-dependent helicase HrpB, partial [Myxococcales bacterium]|nr:ATP-dependent helicase HrpB [Myxococcales bacterium]
LDLFPEAIDEREELTFVAERGRVEGRAELRYEGLVIDASPLRRLPPAASELLRQAALSAGPGRFVRDPEALVDLQARAAFAAAHDPAIPTLDDAWLRDLLGRLCEGLSSFAELERADLLGHVRAELLAAGDRLDRLAPTHARLAGGRRAPIRYSVDQPPALASRLQDFFGMERGPSVADGRVPVVLHLLAPNGRDVQVTTDLAGFWDRHYPELRRALMRRYPRHAWPEDPRQPPPPRPPRR